MPLSFFNIRKRLTGFSTPFGGLEWENVPPETPEYDKERDLVTSLLTFLEDRRVLYGSWAEEEPQHVTRSVLQIRERLTKELEVIEGDSFLYTPLAAMRAACRKFLDETQRLQTSLEIRDRLYLPRSGYG